jgi:general secretion pathway protein K
MVLGGRSAAGKGEWAESGRPPVAASPNLFGYPAIAVPAAPNDRGVVLIALLWILVALSGIALSFSRESFVEVAAARNAQSLESSYFIARAGIATAIYQMIEKRLIPSVEGAQLQEEPDPLELGIVTGNWGGGDFQVDIQNESGKINLNSVPVEQLRALAEASKIPPQDASIIADSIMDWRDSDKDHRLNGAENDYYESLNPPYRAKNARFDTVEELLLVRGVTPAYFYGHPERTPDGSIVYKYGLSRFLTVYSNRIQINVNFASLPVLMSVPGMTPEAAQSIYERRHVKPFKNTAEITREIPGNLSTVTMPYLTTDPSGVYTLTATAGAGQSKARRVIRTIVNLDQAGDNGPYQTLYWNENIPDYEGIKR